MAEAARYLYAVTRGLDPAMLDEARGLGGGRLDVVGHRGLDAVVSAVDLEEFGEDGLRRNLEDLAWLETVARSHDDVVHAVARHGPAAPLRLATVCLDDEGVRRRLDEWHDEMTAVLDRIEGRSEWSVKVIVNADARSDGPARSDESGASGQGSGAAYLLRKKQETQQRATTEQEALTRADNVYDTLARASVASRRLQPQDPRLSGHQGTMTLNAAFLVDDAESGAFADAVSDLVEQLPEGALHVAGPWPPYSFATLEPS